MVSLALALLLSGFTVGWTLAGNGEALEGTLPRTETSSPAPEPSMSKEDVPGGNISELPRYPGSVRTYYTRDNLDDVVWTEVEYMTTDDLDSVREFYRGVFRSEGWNVGDVGFSNGTWNFFVIEGEREVYVELELRGAPP